MKNFKQNTQDKEESKSKIDQTQDQILSNMGENIQNKPPYFISSKGIVLVPERDKLFENLTVDENLEICTPLTPTIKSEFSRKALMEFIYDYFPVLKDLGNRLGGYLSGGERQMLALASAILCRPILLLVDELSLGLAPLIVEKLLDFLNVIRNEQGITILLVEQNAMAALEIADYGYIMESGRIVYAGDSEKLKNHQDIREFYLGQGDRELQKSYRDVKQYRRSRRWYG